MELAAARRAVLAAVRGAVRAAPTCPACRACCTGCAPRIPSKVMLRFLSEQFVKHKGGVDETVPAEAEICNFDDLVVNNNDVVLKNIAEDLRDHLPIEAGFNLEHLALQKIHQHPLPMIHVDAFLYDDDFVESLREEGKMSRNYCTECGSYKTASLGLTYSSASQLYWVEMNVNFCQLQEMTITKYQFIDRIKVVHADICTQASLLQKADVAVMNNVFEYFLDRQEQARAWEFIACNVRKRGSLPITAPSLEESLSKLQMDIQLSQWVEEMQLN